MTDPRASSQAAREGEPHGHGKVRSEEDRLSSPVIVAVGVAALVLFFVASFLTISYVRVKDVERPPLPAPKDLGLNKIGLVEQQLFETADRGARDRATRRERLGSYGWVDRAQGIVHLPIDRAMELSAQGVRPRATAPQGTSREAQP